MVGAPALALQTDTIIHQQDTATVHPLDHGLSDGATRANRADTRDGLQQLGERSSAPSLDSLAVDGRRLLQVRGMTLLRRDLDLRDDLRILLHLQGDAARGGDSDRTREALIAHTRDLHMDTRGSGAEAQGGMPRLVRHRRTHRRSTADDRPDDGLTCGLVKDGDRELLPRTLLGGGELLGSSSPEGMGREGKGGGEYETEEAKAHRAHSVVFTVCFPHSRGEGGVVCSHSCLRRVG